VHRQTQFLGDVGQQQPFLGIAWVTDGHGERHIAANLRPSARGELEITDVNRIYLARDEATLIPLGRGFVWLDTGTHDALMEAGQYVQVLEHRQGVRIACLEEIAWRMGYIDRDSCYRLGSHLAKSSYGRYIMEVAEYD